MYKNIVMMYFKISVLKEMEKSFALNLPPKNLFKVLIKNEILLMKLNSIKWGFFLLIWLKLFL